MFNWNVAIRPASRFRPQDVLYSDLVVEDDVFGVPRERNENLYAMLAPSAQQVVPVHPPSRRRVNPLYTRQLPPRNPVVIITRNPRPSRPIVAKVSTFRIMPPPRPRVSTVRVVPTAVPTRSMPVARVSSFRPAPQVTTVPVSTARYIHPMTQAVSGPVSTARYIHPLPQVVSRSGSATRRDVVRRVPSGSRYERTSSTTLVPIAEEKPSFIVKGPVIVTRIPVRRGALPEHRRLTTRAGPPSRIPVLVSRRVGR